MGLEIAADAERAPCTALIYAERAADHVLAGRTTRSLRGIGIEVQDSVLSTPAAMVVALREVEAAGCLLIRAGAWMAATPAVPPDGSGGPLMAIGVIRDTRGPAACAHPESALWRQVLTRCGSDLNRLPWWNRLRPLIACCYLNAAARQILGGKLSKSGATLNGALWEMVSTRGVRAVHLSALDVHLDSQLRVVQLVTSIQIGGAERVVLDLAEELSALGTRVCVAALGRPTRLAFPSPANFADLSDIRTGAGEDIPLAHARALAVGRLCGHFAADIVHAHLISASEAAAIKAQGLPLVMSVHNLAQSWPAGFESLGPDSADLLVACAQAVEADLLRHQFAIPIRTVWNGIHPGRYVPATDCERQKSRALVLPGVGPEDFVLGVVANPRRQKRLERLPEIVCKLQQRLGTRRVRLILVGARGGTIEAMDSIAALEREMERWAVGPAVEWAGAVHDVAVMLAAMDVLVAVSDFEGLSLAQLEALAAGVVVVATDVGGSREIAPRPDLLRLLPAGAAAESFVEELWQLAQYPRAACRASGLPASFTRYAMAGRVRSLYPAVIERSRSHRAGGVRSGLWLITNNFSIGGAQSSARRLLVGLKARGVAVCACTIQETPSFPTPGRQALLAAGITVLALAPPPNGDFASSGLSILEMMTVERPEVVLFWNVVVSCKLVIADGLLDTPVYDVSPGEMYFESLEKYFRRPKPGLPYLDAKEYGARLSGVVVKYRAEAGVASALLGTAVHVIANGVACPQMVAKKPGREFVIGTASRISPDKRLEDLLEAFALALASRSRGVSGWVLRIAGGVEPGQQQYAAELRRLARGLPVQWCGPLTDTAAFLAGLDIFAMSSEPAGCPNASLEAMAAGLPVVATDVGGASEQIVNGVTGWLVPRRDVQEFAGALVKLALDPSSRVSFGNAGRARIQSHFSLEAMIAGYAALLWSAPVLWRFGSVTCKPKAPEDWRTP